MRARAGFTLVELLVVIALIGVLSSVVIFAVSNSRAQARDAKRLQDLRSMISQLVNNSSSFVAVSLGCSGSPPFLTTSCAALAQYTDPSPTVQSTTCSKAPFSRPCQYTVVPLNGNTNVTTESFEVCAYLEKGVSGYPAGNVYVNTASSSSPASGCP